MGFFESLTGLFDEMILLLHDIGVVLVAVAGARVFQYGCVAVIFRGVSLFLEHYSRAAGSAFFD